MPISSFLKSATKKPKKKKPSQQQLIVVSLCDLVCPVAVYKGEFKLTSTHIYFDEIPSVAETDNKSNNNNNSNNTTTNNNNNNNNNSNNNNSKKNKAKPLISKSWPLDLIREIHLRRYLLCHSAIELFLDNHKAYFFNFPLTSTREIVFQKLTSFNLPRLISAWNLPPHEILKKTQITEAWQMGELTNFEYLMKLNTIAGRSFNDLTQYPVFPWIISDYTSDELVLDSDSQFRDLKLPMGAINPSRKQSFIERYNFIFFF